jgi:hypothetical protein
MTRLLSTPVGGTLELTNIELLHLQHQRPDNR